MPFPLEPKPLVPLPIGVMQQLPLPHSSCGSVAANCPVSPQGAGCPWGLARLDPAAGRGSGCKDMPPMKPPLPLTSTTQHLPVQLGDTSSCPPRPTEPAGTRHLLQGECFWDPEAWEQWPCLGGRVKPYGEGQHAVWGLP